MQLNYHLYTAPLAHIAHLPANVKPAHHFFIDEELRQQLLKNNESLLNPIGPVGGDVPLEVGVYHSLSMLQETERVSAFFRQPNTLYKATSSQDGRTYMLRRVDGFRASSANVASKMERYFKLSHPGVVSLREAFVTKQFGDTCEFLFFVSLFGFSVFFPDSTFPLPRSVGVCV